MSRTVEYRGCRIAYDLRGTGPRVMFIQGVGVPGAGWQPQVDALADRYSCLTFDNRGVGRSQPAPESLTVEQMADDARAILDAEQWESAHIIGHSLGGLVAIFLALAAPGRVRSLSLLCTFGNGRSAAPLSPRMIWLGLRSRVGTRRMRRRGFLRILLSPCGYAQADPDALAEQYTPLFGHDLADQPPIVDLQLSAMRRADATARLGELAAISTLVVGAAHDPIAPPRVTRALGTGIPGARYVELPDASHGLPIQFADRVSNLLAEHLRAADAGRDL